MRNALLFALLVPVVALAGSNLTPVTKVAAEEGVPTVPVQVGGRQPDIPVQFVGTVDTIGGTVYDWQANGPAYTFLVHSADQGIHALWMFSSDLTGSFPDRNMRYNFYDVSGGSWNWIDPDFMASGVNAYTSRVGFGNLSADPATGVAYVSAHGGSPIRVIAARDMAPGAGIFEYSNGPDAYLWGYIAGGQGSRLHVAMNDDASRDMIYYAKVDPWPTWSTPLAAAAPKPDPLFPDQNVAASKVSQKVCIIWEYSEPPAPPDQGFYRISTDAGATWGDPTELVPPTAYGGDTTTSYHISSFFPYYDGNDRLHIAASLMPYVGENGYVIPAQIWHWSPDNNPNWSHITTATCDPENLGAPVGSNNLYASRASLGEDAAGNLYVAWEQFDSSNVEPTSDRLRADIFVAGSGDNGQTWGSPVKITTAGTNSCRYPSIMDMVYDDKVAVLYTLDAIAGSFVQAEGASSNNPIVCHWVPKSAIPIGIAEPPQSRTPARTEVVASPNPFGRSTVISYALPRSSNVSVTVYDAAGRPVRTLEQGRRQAGRYSVAWDGRSANGDPVAAGIYFYSLVTDETSLSEKLIVVR